MNTDLLIWCCILALHLMCTILFLLILTHGLYIVSFDLFGSDPFKNYHAWQDGKLPEESIHDLAYGLVGALL